MALSPMQLQQNREDFLDIIQNTWEKEPKQLKQFLDDSDFWEAPASTKYHEAYEGGLVEHSLKVYEHLTMLNYHHFLGFSDETISKTALFHDLCKANFYRRSQRSKRTEEGRWYRTVIYEVNDQFPAGHGEKSVTILLVLGVPMTEEEILAIRHHMGAWDASGFGQEQALTASMTKSKLVTALHLADMMAVWL